MTQDAIDRVARKLMALRPKSENAVNPHARLAAGLRHLAEVKEADEWFHALPVVTTEEFLKLVDLPDVTNTRPPDLVDIYTHGTAEHSGARRRLVAATVRRGYPLHNPRLCWGCDGEVDETTLACDCFTPANTKESR